LVEQDIDTISLIPDTVIPTSIAIKQTEAKLKKSKSRKKTKKRKK